MSAENEIQTPPVCREAQSLVSFLVVLSQRLKNRRTTRYECNAENTTHKENNFER